MHNNDSINQIKTTNSQENLAPTVKETELRHEPVNGAALFDELTKTFNRYLTLQPYQAETLALWSIFSHCYDAGDIAPKLLIHSPEKRCGKSTLMEVLSGLVWNSLLVTNITPAVIYRFIESAGITLMIDEADTFIKDNSEMAGIINSGHKRSGAHVARCVGDNHEPKKFSTWAPTVIAMIGKPQDTIVDRSIVITMRRKRQDEQVERFISRRVEAETKELNLKMVRWCADNFDTLVNSDPQTPEELNDRAADNWRPLLAIADLISEECSKISRAAAIILSKREEDEESTSPAVLLLSSIREIFQALREERIPTEKMLANLIGMEDGTWAEWNRGREITARQVALHLKTFGIAPKKMRIGYETCRGYEISQFQDAFSRYLGEAVNQSNAAAEDEAVPDHVPRMELFKMLKNNESSVVPHSGHQSMEDR